MSDHLRAFNRAEPAEAERELLACCASRRWARELLARRPYADLAGLRAVSARVLAGLTWADVEEALAAHPRIGERAAGQDREAAWSREEQAGAETREDLAAGNRVYEERFGHVFLIHATGLSAETMLTSLRARLGNDRETEREVVRAELGKIVDLRLGKAFGT
ncbi:2-oxo-4-hydroxy-4-carboxy-5-ureidoimidazoline decarboxylase [Actinophytocola gossypii]|uniref:2-oxo-4-hydroxy-4-carboxy-5-ureidoimidazoline decarboxylase n=1 Tax=Actinophytocola gossypii TaxID=2812003 RepID=A0ABT2J7K4_9PSEU|nr:2-oxo-4-hydroxy-4-carboxy-5-ureidoimidazoline decarboxylase [Actinophytocola gossypii]MCT2583835.1 2-oxo-4-hydroxy-4-carboxy-5-ureidoimidazoline decarboxylase [Actinophytocola gossypii]